MKFSSSDVSCHLGAAQSSKRRAINGQVGENSCGGRASWDCGFNLPESQLGSRRAQTVLCVN